MIKVLWDIASCDSTWEIEEEMRTSHHDLFIGELILEDENFVVGE